METLQSIVVAIPQMLMLVAGMVFAVARWKHHPTISLLVIVASGIEMLVRIGWEVLPRLLTRFDAASSQFYLAMSVVSTLIGCATQGMMLFAVFSGRSTGTEAPVQRW